MLWGLPSQQVGWQHFGDAAFGLSLPQWMEWHPQAHVLLAGTADGNTWMWKIPSGDCKTFQGPACPATCGRILPDGEAWGLWSVECHQLCLGHLPSCFSQSVLKGRQEDGGACLYLLSLSHQGSEQWWGMRTGPCASGI